MYAVYHGRTKDTGENRVVFMDEIKIKNNGELIVNGPITTPVQHPLRK